MVSHRARPDFYWQTTTRIMFDGSLCSLVHKPTSDCLSFKASKQTNHTFVVLLTLTLHPSVWQKKEMIITLLDRALGEAVGSWNQGQYMWGLSNFLGEGWADLCSNYIPNYIPNSIPNSIPITFLITFQLHS